MRVHIQPTGVELVPYNVLDTSTAMTLANKAEYKTDVGVYAFTYFCMAENGLKRTILDLNKLEEGDYTLPDTAWLVPDEGEGVSEEEW